jgi:hypothetical protein
MTNQQAFLLISGIIFGIVALLHVFRLALRWQIRINQREVPMWVSVGGLIVAAGLSFWGLWLLF